MRRLEQVGKILSNLQYGWNGLFLTSITLIGGRGTNSVSECPMCVTLLVILTSIEQLELSHLADQCDCEMISE